MCASMLSSCRCLSSAHCVRMCSSRVSFIVLVVKFEIKSWAVQALHHIEFALAKRRNDDQPSRLSVAYLSDAWTPDKNFSYISAAKGASPLDVSQSVDHLNFARNKAKLAHNLFLL